MSVVLYITRINPNIYCQINQSIRPVHKLSRACHPDQRVQTTQIGSSSGLVWQKIQEPLTQGTNLFGVIGVNYEAIMLQFHSITYLGTSVSPYNNFLRIIYNLLTFCSIQFYRLCFTFFRLSCQCHSRKFQEMSTITGRFFEEGFIPQVISQP